MKVTPDGGDPGEGFFFVVHNDPAGPAGLGAGGSGMGWAGLQNAFGVKFDFSTRWGARPASTPRARRSAATPPTRNRVIPDRFDLDSGKTLHVNLWYDIYEHRLNETIDDVGDLTTAPFITSYDVDIPEAAGGETAYVGFTAATRNPAVANPTDGSARQEILDFYYGMVHGDFFGARVTQVFVNGQGITGQTSANGVAFRNLAGIDNTFGYPVPGAPTS